MKYRPLVSVIIPAYNCEKYIESSVCSILNQSYANIEILICDDCSKDSTFSILKSIANSDSRIKLFRNDENKGIVYTLNRLIMESSGDYIARMDADDISGRHRIEKQVHYMLKNNLDFCGTNACLIDDKSRILGYSSLPVTKEGVRNVLAFACPFFHPTMMLRSDVLKANLYSEEFCCAEDYELWCRLILNGAFSYGNIKERLFFYRVNPNGITQGSSGKHFEALKRCLLKYNLVQDIDMFMSLYHNAQRISDIEILREYARSCISGRHDCKRRNDLYLIYFPLLSFFKENGFIIDCFRFVFSYSGLCILWSYLNQKLCLYFERNKTVFLAKRK